jgi:hypothetical protein
MPAIRPRSFYGEFTMIRTLPATAAQGADAEIETRAAE